MFEASLSTVKRAQRRGMTPKHTRYCQLISEVSKEKQMEWCLDTVIADNLYMDVVDFSTSASYFIIILLMAFK